jgi:hypothetical protein
MEEKEYVLYTNLKGLYDFDTEVRIETNDLPKLVRETRNNLYKVTSELENIKANRFYKILHFLKLI